jgi:hypothetical protein
VNAGASVSVVIVTVAVAVLTPSLTVYVKVSVDALDGVNWINTPARVAVLPDPLVTAHPSPPVAVAPLVLVILKSLAKSSLTGIR